MGFFNWVKSLFSKPQKVVKYEWEPEWTESLHKLIEGKLETFSAAKDIEVIYPNFRLLNNSQKVEVLAEFFKWLAYYESGWNPSSQSVDVGVDGHPDSYSIGLLQVSVDDQKNLGIPLGYDFFQLLAPLANLILGIEIMCNQIRKRGKILISRGEKGNPGLYWATLCPGGRYDKSQEIISKVRSLRFEMEKENSNDTPWMDIAKKEIGMKEVPGSGNNPRVVEYHSATTLKATEDSVPWCSAFVSWCLEQAEIKSTKNAWARSYLQWGKKLDKPRYGCVVVFSRGDNSGHVGFFQAETEDTIMVLGGNQSDSVCIKEYPKSRLLGYRWPS